MGEAGGGDTVLYVLYVENYSVLTVLYVSTGLEKEASFAPTSTVGGRTALDVTRQSKHVNPDHIDQSFP